MEIRERLDCWREASRYRQVERSQSVPDTIFLLARRQLLPQPQHLRAELLV